MRHCRSFVADGLENLGQHALADGVGIDWPVMAEHRGFGVAAPGQLPCNGECAADKRNALITAQVLHAGLRDQPHWNRGIQIELGTARWSYGIEAHAGENDHLQQPRRQHLHFAQFRHEHR